MAKNKGAKQAKGQSNMNAKNETNGMNTTNETNNMQGSNAKNKNSQGAQNNK